MRCGECGQKSVALFEDGKCFRCRGVDEKTVEFVSTGKDHQAAAREHIANEQAKRSIRRRRGFE